MWTGQRKQHVRTPDRRIGTFRGLRPRSPARERFLPQLFSNLLGNAFSYGTADQPIRVRAAIEMGSLEVSVANAGEPIPYSAVEHLFQLSQRGSS